MRRIALFGLVFSSAMACGSSGATTTGTTSGGGGSGGSAPVPYHAPTNGTHVTEAAACTELRDAQQTTFASFGCGAFTGRACPQLLRAQTALTCVEYDDGSIKACAQDYAKASSCQVLRALFDDCLVTGYAGTMSAGCVP